MCASTSGLSNVIFCSGDTSGGIPQDKMPWQMVKDSSSCTARKCEAFCMSGYILEGNVCVKTVSTPSPVPPNVPSCTNGAANPPSCTQCPAGKVLVNGVCADSTSPTDPQTPPVPPAQVCQPGSVTSCTPTSGGGTGQKTCYASGAGYGLCYVVSCLDGYHKSGSTVCATNRCAATAPANTSICSGDETRSSSIPEDRMPWTTVSDSGSCTTAKKCEAYCKSGYRLISGVCQVQVN